MPFLDFLTRAQSKKDSPVMQVRKQSLIKQINGMVQRSENVSNTKLQLTVWCLQEGNKVIQLLRVKDREFLEWVPHYQVVAKNHSQWLALSKPPPARVSHAREPDASGLNILLIRQHRRNQQAMRIGKKVGMFPKLLPTLRTKAKFVLQSMAVLKK